MGNAEFSGGFSPRDKDWWVYSFSTVEIAAAQAQGSQLIAPISSIPVRQGERWLHVREIDVAITFRMDTSTTMAADIAGSEVAGVATQVSLMDIFGWEYIRGGESDGRAVSDAMGLLQNFRAEVQPLTILDATTNDVLRTAIIRIRFNPGPRDQYTLERVWDQVQPLAIFNERSGSAGLRLRLGATLPGAPTGVTDNTVTLVEVSVRTIADKDLHGDAPWWMRVQRFTQTSFIALPDAAGKDPYHRMLFSYIRHTPQDAQGQNLSDYGSLTIKHGEDEWLSGRSAIELARQMNTFVVEDGVGRIATNVGTTAGALVAAEFVQDVDTPTIGFLPLMQTRPGALHSEWGQSPLYINLTRSSNRPDTRVISYGYNEGMTDDYAKMIGALVGLPPDRILIASKLGSTPTTGTPAAFAAAAAHAPFVIRSKG